MDNWYQHPGLRKDKLRGVDRPTPSKLPTQRQSYSHQFLYLGPSGSITKDSNSKGAGGAVPVRLNSNPMFIVLQKTEGHHIHAQCGTPKEKWNIGKRKNAS